MNVKIEDCKDCPYKFINDDGKICCPKIKPKSPLYNYVIITDGVGVPDACPL